MVVCENCSRQFQSARTGGKPPRYCSRKCFGIANSGPNSYMWRDNPNYWTRHGRVRRARGPAKSHPCEHCGGPARDWAVRHGQTGISPDDYMPLCRKCHIQYDGTAHEPPHHTGEANPAAKLTIEQVREIRALHGHVPPRHLAATYGVSKQTIHRIMTGKNWKAI